jgi:uroporphyrinogen decarboxylase
MTKKERVKAAIALREPDIVPWQVNCLSAAERKLRDHFGEGELDEFLGNHIALFEPSYFSLFRTEILDDNRFKDAFGATWELKPGEDIGTVIGHPLKEPTLKGYDFPDPEKVMELDNIPSFIEKNKDKFIMGGLGFSLYERAWILRGVEYILTDFLENPVFVEELFERITEFNLAITKRLCLFPVDAFHFGDDWGQQYGLLIHPDLWRRFFKKPLKKMYDVAHNAGLPVSIHSCGNITEIIPDLIEIGVNNISPLQAEALDFTFLKKEYGKYLSFWGGISTQKTLPFGSPEDVRAEIRKTISVLAKDGGYILSPSHDLQGDIPLENILTFIDEAQNQKF